MKTEQVRLSQIKVNSENPRTITSDKFNKLINSILVLPKMLELRPVVVDRTMKALGGNMRTNALKEIAKMKPEQIASRLASLSDFNSKTAGEKQLLIEYWGNWLEKPVALVIKASELSEDEKKQFIIKDNVSFGTWDYDLLANNWDSSKLEDWGMDVWQANPAEFATSGASNYQGDIHPSEDDGSLAGALPPELQGLDLNPDELPKIQGDDETAMERVIIVYEKERLPELMQLLGMTQLDKIVYRLEEILPSATTEE